MANIVLLKKSSVAAKVPLTTDLAYGEVALNYTDGKLYYKTASNTIDQFDSISATATLTNKTLTSPVISGGTINNAVIGGTTPAAITGSSVTSTGNLVSSYSVGDEGGEILLTKPQTNTSIAGAGVRIDIYQNKLRIWEDGGSNRGAYIDLTAAANTVGTNLIAAAGGGTVTSITAGTGLTGGTISTSGTIAIDSTVATLTGTQSLTNKTLNNTNTVSLKDTLFTLQDATDTTKQVQFDVNSGQTTGTTRTFTLPTTTTTLAGLGVAQTWTATNTFQGTVTLNDPVDGATNNFQVGTAVTNTTYKLGFGSTSSGNTKTVELGTGGASGSTTTIAIGSVNGTTVTANGAWTFANDAVFTGNLTVNGTTTTINSTTISVDDKNIELGSVASPTDVTADGGGITLKGATDKTIIWGATNGWTSSEDINVASGKIYRINGTSVLSSTTLGSGVTGSSLTSVGTITTGTWSGSFGAVSGANLTSLTAGNLSGTIPSGVLGNSTVYIGTTAVALNRATANLALTGITSIDGTAAGLSATLVATSGGTGQSTYAIGDLLQGGATNTLTKLAAVATGNVLLSGGVTTASEWGKVGLTTHVSGTLPIANGGTNLTTYTTGDIVYASASNTLASLADVATGNALISGGVGVAPSYGKIGLTTHVSGTLAVGNGGTGLTTLTANYIPYGNGTSALQSSASLQFNGSGLGVGGAATTALDVTATGGMMRINGASGNNLIQAQTGATVGLGLWAGGNSRLYSTGALTIAVNSTLTTAAPTGYTDALTISTAGNLGLGVTPSAWGSNWKAIESSGNSATAYAAANINGLTLISNAYNDNTNFVYKTTGGAARYSINNSIHQWFTAPSGTASTTATFTERMSLSEAGLLNIAGLTASSAVATDASKNLVSVATTGTGSYVLAASPTLTGTTTVSRLTAGTRSMYGQATLDLTALDAATYYPVTIPLPSTRTSTLRIEVGLNSGSVPTWSTHPSGFACFVEWTVSGSGFGVWNIQRTIKGYTEQWTNVTIIGGISQMTNTSQEVIYLRGGGKYFFSADNDLTPTIQTASYTASSQTVAPSATVINTPTSTGNASIGAGSLNLSGLTASGVVLTDANKTLSTSTLLPIANGGTNSSATATLGGVGYGTGTAHAYTAAGTAGQVLTSNGGAAPTWSTPTSVTIGLTPPVSPSAGALWWDSYNGALKIYYTDGDTSQWVDAFISSGGITTNDVITALGYTPYNAANPSGYVSTAVTSAVAGTGVSVSAGTGAVTFSIGQAVATSSSVQFGSLGVGFAASGATGEIRATNNVTAFYSSDARLKENVREIPNALDKVSAIGGKLYSWTDEYIASHGGLDPYFLPKESFGVIAQDVEQVFPEAVRTREDGYLAVDYEKMCALAFQAIKELQEKVNTLEQQIKGK